MFCSNTWFIDSPPRNPTYPQNIPRTLKPVFMNKILSYMDFGVPWVYWNFLWLIGPRSRDKESIFSFLFVDVRFDTFLQSQIPAVEHLGRQKHLTSTKNQQITPLKKCWERETILSSKKIPTDPWNIPHISQNANMKRISFINRWLRVWGNVCWNFLRFPFWVGGACRFSVAKSLKLASSPWWTLGVNVSFRVQAQDGSMCARVDQLPWHFHIIGDKLINPIVGVYIPMIRIPIKGGMSWPSPKKRDFWPVGTCMVYLPMWMVDVYGFHVG